MQESAEQELPSRPLLTVAIPTWNGARFLNEAVESVVQAAEVGHDVEVLIVDNNSTDATPQICQDLMVKHSGIRYVRNDRLLPVNENILRAVAESRGRYVWILADDDVLSEEACSIVLDQLIESEPVLVLVNFQTVGENLERPNSFGSIDDDLSLLDLQPTANTPAPGKDQTPVSFSNAESALLGTGFAVFGLLSAIVVCREKYLDEADKLIIPIPSQFDFLYLIPMVMRQGITVFVRTPLILFRQYKKRWIIVDDYSQAMDNYFIVIPHILHRLESSGFDGRTIRHLRRRNLRNFAVHVGVAKSKGMKFRRGFLVPLVKTNYSNFTFWIQLPAILMPRKILIRLAGSPRLRNFATRRGGGARANALREEHEW